MTITPARAVMRGHLTVTGPVLLVIMSAGIVGHLRFGHAWMGVLAGAVLAWPLWSYQVPRWRDWVEDQGLRPEEVHDIAVRTGLLWPRGSLLERTEFKRRDGRVGW